MISPESIGLSISGWLPRIAFFLVLSLGLCIAFVLQRVWQRKPFPPNAPKHVKSDEWPVLGSLGFFTQRWDFHRESSLKTPTGNFSYYVGKHPLVGLRGEQERKLFFESGKLSPGAGYAVLFGSAPKVRDITEDKVDDGFDPYFARRITRLLKKDMFERTLTHLLTDVKGSVDALAESGSGITDPFESIYDIVYQLTMRMVGCNEIADNPALLKRTHDLFETIENSATASGILFPNLPTPSKLKRFIAGTRLYMIFQKIVSERQKSGKREEDALQYLVDQGDSVQAMVTFVVGALFAGQLNSGVNSAYVLIYLASDPYWMGKVREEIDAVARKYGKNQDAPLVNQLADVPLEAWETEFPVVDMCLKDCIRLQLLGSAMRRNVSGGDIHIGNEVIPKDAFVTYPMADIHQDPNIYPDPMKWDPARYTPERSEHLKAPHAFLGWGSGRHPCLGMRFALLEQNIITCYFLAMFDYHLVDKHGNPSNYVPPPNLNAHTTCKPNPRVYLKYSLRK